jgi:hypothetical protein
MATKVMVAPAIQRSAVAVPTTARRAAASGDAPRPRRRRSSVYDADGHEVFITLMCLKCHKMRPLSLFGLRKMADGAIRNQPWCRTCRSAAGTKGTRESAEIVDSPLAEASVEPQAAATPEAEKVAKPSSGALAAEVAAALSAGLGR